MLCVNCLSWVFYGLLQQNYYIFCPNVVGVDFCFYYTLTIFHLVPEEKRNQLKNMLIGGFTFVAVGALVAFVTIVPYDDDEHTKATTIMGIVACIVLIIFYSSPLSGLYQVIKTRDASSISYPLALANGVNGPLWTGYGFAIQDYVCF